MRSTILMAVVAALAVPAGAQDKAWTTELSSALDSGAASADGKPPRLDPLSGPQVKLKPKEAFGVRHGKSWADNPDFPARGPDGSIVFQFGATLPVIVCAPLYVCDLSLEAGEVVNDINIGDGVRWQITPATQGSGASAIIHVIIKPTDIGLVTNLVITTDRRAYTIKLVSRREDWMPKVSFFYPDAVQQQWSAYRTQQERQREAADPEPREARPADLDFAYDISGDSPAWRPVRVYSGGGKTYIQFPAGVRHGDLPALVALGDDSGLFSEPSKQLVNYRYVNGRFEVDKVLDRAALISGVGWDQLSVTIHRRGGR
jgi:P-type conjugative transfer protein TrbG